MTTTFIGTTFPAASDWYADEKSLIASVQQQIDQAFPTSQNLFINTTWFGPQFDNKQWDQYKQVISQQKFDRLFLLAAADPVFLNAEQIDNMQKETNAQLYLLGHFDTEYYFNFHSQVLPRYFVNYTEQQLLMQEPTRVYVNYNRKPREHRTELVNLLEKENLLQHGVVTLGKHNNIYSKTQSRHLTLNETVDDAVGNWGMDMSFGIPHDIHSLGNLDIWQNHFLNIVSETEFLPWDNMFISEKTWKPILGLRPFVINGQTKIYQYLNSQGFKTFEQYFNGIDVINVNEKEIHNAIVDVVEYFSKLSAAEITSIYQSMLPDLIHNRNRFAEFSVEQQLKIGNLFV